MLGIGLMMYARWSLARGDVNGARVSRIALRKFIVDAELSVPIDEIDVILGELASNAVRYGADPMAIAVIVKENVLEICTFDSGLGYDLEQKLGIDPTDVNGRGLRILKAFSNGLRVCREANGDFCVCASIAIA